MLHPDYFGVSGGSKGDWEVQKQFLLAKAVDDLAGVCYSSAGTEAKKKPLVGGFYVYPPVNIQKTMETHHF